MGQILHYGKTLKAPSPYQSVDKNKRLIHVIMCKGMHLTKTGVYRLWFGDYFYIGRANNIRTRAKQHMKELEININKKEPKDNYQRKMLKHLQDHPEISFINIEILEECPAAHLNEREEYWLKKLGDDKKCLNVTLIARKTYEDKSREDFQFGVYQVQFCISDLEQYTAYRKLIKERNVTSYSLIKKL